MSNLQSFTQPLRKNYEENFNGLINQQKESHHNQIGTKRLPKRFCFCFSLI